MFCGKCGRELKEGARFCGGCGAPVAAAPEAPPAPAATYKLRIVWKKQFMGAAMKIKVDDSEEAISLKTGKSVELEVPAGPHTVVLRLNLRFRTVKLNVTGDVEIQTVMNTGIGMICYDVVPPEMEVKE